MNSPNSLMMGIIGLDERMVTHSQKFKIPFILCGYCDWKNEVMTKKVEFLYKIILVTKEKESPISVTHAIPSTLPSE